MLTLMLLEMQTNGNIPSVAPMGNSLAIVILLVGVAFLGEAIHILRKSGPRRVEATVRPSYR